MALLDNVYKERYAISQLDIKIMHIHVYMYNIQGISTMHNNILTTYYWYFIILIAVTLTKIEMNKRIKACFDAFSSSSDWSQNQNSI